jgi:hypothetical protein
VRECGEEPLLDPPESRLRGRSFHRPGRTWRRYNPPIDISANRTQPQVPEDANHRPGE